MGSRRRAKATTQTQRAAPCLQLVAQTDTIHKGGQDWREHYQKCGHRNVCSIRVFKMDFHVIKLSITDYPQSIDCPSLVSITEAIA